MAKDGHFIKTKQTLIYIKLFRSARKYFFSSKFNSRSVSETKKNHSIKLYYSYKGNFFKNITIIRRWLPKIWRGKNI